MDLLSLTPLSRRLLLLAGGLFVLLSLSVSTIAGEVCVCPLSLNY